MLSSEAFEMSLRESLVNVHMHSAQVPIRFPTAHGAFPSDPQLVTPLAVVPDACRLRDDVLYACRRERRTVLITAANAGLLRLFCAPHVIDEVERHSGDWTRGSGVSQRQFLSRWRTEYLPVIRVVFGDLADTLDADEGDRLAALARIDPDDVPSATLALVLEAFYLSNDAAALRAVYGADADLSAHDEWLEVLKAGGDAGELGRMFQLAANVIGLLGSGLMTGSRRLLSSLGPWGALLLVLLAAAALRKTSEEARQRVTGVAGSMLLGLAQLFAAYQVIAERFQRAVPAVPSWTSLATSIHGDALLARVSLHTLARNPIGHHSAAELAHRLPLIDVASGEAKVRGSLRSHSYFFEAWRGRWQVGQPDTSVMALAPDRELVRSGIEES